MSSSPPSGHYFCSQSGPSPISVIRFYSLGHSHFTLVPGSHSFISLPLFPVCVFFSIFALLFLSVACRYVAKALSCRQQPAPSMLLAVCVCVYFFLSSACRYHCHRRACYLKSETTMTTMGKVSLISITIFQQTQKVWRGNGLA